MPGNPHATTRRLLTRGSKLFMPDVWKEMADAPRKI